MREEYDFSNAKKNPYASQLKRQPTINVTINIDGITIDSSTIDYFKAQSESVGIPYQTLINLYLRDCAVNKRTLDLSWR